MIVNKLNWLSSTKAINNSKLNELNDKLAVFYSSLDGRGNYQKMIDSTHNNESNFIAQTADKFATLLMQHNFQNVLEFGCGSGKMYKQLMTKGFQGSYTGYEMADYVIEDNKQKMGNASWKCGSIYDNTIPENSFDAVFSFFVLEHLVFPEKALANQMRIIKPGGSIFMVFPDMVESLIFSSQKLGLNKLSGVKGKLQKGKLLDAIVTYFETNKYRYALKNLQKIYGDFVINVDPICFEKNTQENLIPDMDAVYVAYANEIENWAIKGNYKVNFPFGKEGVFLTSPFIQITK